MKGAFLFVMLLGWFQGVLATEKIDDWDHEAFLEDVEFRTFQYFWKTGDNPLGLIPDKYPENSPSSIATVGFGLTSYLIGVERGYVTRAAAAERVLRTLRFFWQAPQSERVKRASGFKGFFYHFLDMKTGLRSDLLSTELSSIDTTLLLAGVLSVQTYFDHNNAIERRIRRLADNIYRRVDWHWFMVDPPLVRHGWEPESGFHQRNWQGYCEAMLLYILGMGSPSHPIDPQAWNLWTQSYVWGQLEGEEFVQFHSLFAHHFSHLWIDFRGIQDSYMRIKGIDYFENSRRATLSNQKYAIRNPRKWKGYSELVWGLSASSGPGEGVFPLYMDSGVSTVEVKDYGTITPSAAEGSMPFTPSISLATLRYFKNTYGEKIYGEFGFLDAFNLSATSDKDPQGWFASNYVGATSGPSLMMIENYRTNFIWNLMKHNKYIVRGLKRAGFTGGWLSMTHHQGNQVHSLN